MNDQLLSTIATEANDSASADASRRLVSGLAQDLCIGELLALNFAQATVLVHDYARNKVRGLPHGSFLVATRIPVSSNEFPVAEDEDSSLVLLRIVGEKVLPNARQMEEYRFQAGIRATETEEPWDAPSTIDEWTRNNLSFGGYECRVLGTFRMKQDTQSQYSLSFGGDLLNFYAGKGMKVYKPTGVLLESIVNFQKTADAGFLASAERLRVGRVRYAASEISVDESADNVQVTVDPRDFVSRRTFYGGMSRGGKSNAMKVTAKAVYQLRIPSDAVRIGQLIFDPNGEYANDNAQDSGSLKSVHNLLGGSNYGDEVATYGLHDHPNDPERKIVKINFFGQRVSDWSDPEHIEDALSQLIVGKEIIDAELSEAAANYIKAFRDTEIVVPQDLSSQGEQTRFRRLILVYRGLLAAAGFQPSSTSVSIRRLFSSDLRQAMEDNRCDGDKHERIAAAAGLLGEDNISWGDLVDACKGLLYFLDDSSSGWAEFNREYRRQHEGRPWADEDLINLLQILKYSNGVRGFSRLASQHSASATNDYAEEVVSDLGAGKLVIFDQSTGDPVHNAAAAERILWAIFNRQKAEFIDPKRDESGELIPPRPIMVYLEEAHNLLPAAGGKDELRTIWARTAKEGSKYQIGLVLATQEPSSVMPAILKNTDNWFIAHLNNADETRTVSKFYDFDDYSHQITTITDPGFVRMRTLSNPFTIPVQIDLFSV